MHRAVAILITSLVLAACNSERAGSDSATTAVDTTRTTADTGWIELAPGTERAGYSLAADGTLSRAGRRFSPALPRRISDDTASARLAISPPSPDGRWAIAQSAGATFSVVHVLDLQQGTTRESPATKYGIVHWVSWSPSGRYAVVSNHTEATVLLYRIDLATGEARPIEFSGVAQPPLSVTPLEASLRWNSGDSASFAIAGRLACNSAVESCAAAPPAQLRIFNVDLSTMRVTDG